MHYSRTRVEIYNQYELVATHKRVRSPHNYSTIPEHMPSQHRYLSEWSPAFFLEKARIIGPAVEYYISQVLAKNEHRDQIYKSCQGILSLATRAGHDRLIKACQRASDIGYYNYKTIDDILKKNMDQYEEDNTSTPMPMHTNIRGGNYYQ
jgi:hypothetical protein